MTRRPFVLAALVVALSLPASGVAQTPRAEPALRQFFEGMRVTLRIDMPAASEGVNVPMDRPFDQSRYKSRLGYWGVAIPAGQVATVTLVKIKDDLIEFQLDGGGFGTFGDDTSTTVDMPLVEKSNRERDLERMVRDERDATRKRELQRELDDLRNARERENRRITATKTLLEQQKRREVQERRLRGGSRFNISWAKVVPADVTPQTVITALSEYVDFSQISDTQAPPTRKIGPPDLNDSLPRKGMLRSEAEDRWGRPISSSDRMEGTLRVVTLVFTRGDMRITGEFVEDVLVRFTVSSRELPVPTRPFAQGANLHTPEVDRVTLRLE